MDKVKCYSGLGDKLLCVETDAAVCHGQKFVNFTTHSARHCMEKSARCETLYADNRTVQDTVLK